MYGPLAVGWKSELSRVELSRAQGPSDPPRRLDLLPHVPARMYF